jgi:hypothetical protein
LESRRFISHGPEASQQDQSRRFAFDMSYQVDLIAIVRNPTVDLEFLSIVPADPDFSLGRNYLCVLEPGELKLFEHSLRKERRIALLTSEHNFQPETPSD